MSPLPINHPLLNLVRRVSELAFSPLGVILLVAAGVVIFGCAYTVDQTEQVVITQFGRPVGEPINASAADSSSFSPPSLAMPYRLSLDAVWSCS